MQVFNDFLFQVLGKKKHKKTADLTKTKIGFISCIPRNYDCKYIIYYSPIVSFEKKSCYLHFSA